MPEASEPYALRQPLSIGNVINVGFYLYRSHLRLYSKLSLVAHLWLFVPIYGWAKFLAISALISRLVFGELMGQTESVDTAQRYVNRRIWKFLLLGLFVVIMTCLATLVLTILCIIGVFILAIIVSIIAYFTLNLNSFEQTGFWSGVVIAVLILLVVPLSALWFYSRFFVVDLPLATEKNMGSLKTLQNTWKLTKGFMKQIQGVIAITFLITLPVLIIARLGTGLIFLGVINRFLSRESIFHSINFTTYLISLFLLSGIVTMPIWQSIKAVVYYDIGCRRESWDLKGHLSDSQAIENQSEPFEGS